MDEEQRDEQDARVEALEMLHELCEEHDWEGGAR
jgi:hypothetical protein